MSDNHNDIINWGDDDHDESSEHSTEVEGEEIVVAEGGDFAFEFEGDEADGFDEAIILDDDESLPGYTSVLSTSEEVVIADSSYVPVFADEDEETVTVVQIDPRTGDEVTEVVNLSSPPLTTAQAKELTERIRTTVNVLYLLIKRAHAGKAYKALGYKTFEEYVREEFKFSRSYAYRLLNQANVIAAIEEAAPEGTEIYIGNPAVKELKRVLPVVLEEVAAQTAGLAPEAAVDVIEDIIRDHREQQRVAAENSEDDFSEEGFGEDGGRHGEGPYNGDGNFDDDDEFAGDPEVDSFAESDPGDIGRRFNTLYNVFAGMKSVLLVHDADDESVVSLIPPDRYAEFTGLFEESLTRLQSLQAFLKTKIENDDSSDDEGEDGSEIDLDSDSDFGENENESDDNSDEHDESN